MHNHLNVRSLLRTLLFFIGALIVFSYVDAMASPRTLNEYIKTRCKVNCIDTEVLTMAVKDVSQEFDLNPTLLLAIIDVESKFQYKSINKNSGKSVGLMQIQVFWHKNKFKSKNYFDPFDNIRVGASIYKECVDRWKGSKDKALWCYNGHTSSGMKKYVPKVLSSYKQLALLETP